MCEKAFAAKIQTIVENYDGDDCGFYNAVCGALEEYNRDVEEMILAIEVEYED